MTHLMRDDAGRQAQRVTHLVQIVAELANKSLFGERAGQEPSIGRQWIEGTKESEAVNQFANKSIHGDHPFRLEFAKGYVNRPSIRSGGAEAL